MTPVNDFVITEPIRFALEKLPESFSKDLYLETDDTVPMDGYRRVVEEDVVSIYAAKDAGFMYGILDIADALKRNEELKDQTVEPYLERRGLKFNIPLDARTPSYTDAGTNAWKNIANMWSEDFWKEFLDGMAMDKYNVLSLWTESLFPSLVRIPEFPECCLDDVKISMRPVKATTRGMNLYSPDMADHLFTVKKITIDEKMDFWRWVMEYAKSRCIEVYFFTWNVFVYGTEGNPYGITDSMFNPVTRDFFYYGTRAIMEAYPLLSGIGITAGENMAHTGGSILNDDPNYKLEDVDFTLNTYGKGVNDFLKEHPDRDFRIIHRMQMARYRDILNEFSTLENVRTDISFKYSQAHMYSSTHPKYIRTFLEDKEPETKFWLTVRNDDFYFLRWGDPQFARDYLAQMPAESMVGFYMGPDGICWAKDYTSRKKDYTPQFTDKMWYMYKMWGQLAYNMELTDEYFINEIAARFGISVPTARVMHQCWAEASMLIPEFDQVHWHDFDFQWYPEGCCMRDTSVEKIVFADIHEFMSCPATLESDYESAPECAEKVLTGKETGKKCAWGAAENMQKHVDTVRTLLEDLWVAADRNEELRDTLKDIESFADLGAYYSKKLRAAIDLLIYKGNGDASRKAEAVGFLKEAAADWKNYSARFYANYKPQVLSRLGDKIDVTDFDDLTDADILLAEEM